MCAASVRRRPAAGSATGRVWEIADELTRGRGSLPSGREVAEAYYREGGNEGTALTQYSYWKKAYLARVEREAARPVAGVRRAQWRIDAAGRLVIPPDFLAGMQLGDDGRVTARLEDGELRLITPRAALRRLRAVARELARDGGAVVEGFIEGRRREADRE